MNIFKKNRGFVLIEIIVFITVIGILTTGILISFGTTLRNIPRITYQASSLRYAISCIEWLLGQRHYIGFANISINQQEVPPYCSNILPNGYSITVNISTTINNISYSDSNYTSIQTTVTSPFSLGSTSVSCIIANY